MDRKLLALAPIAVLAAGAVVGTPVWADGVPPDAPRATPTLAAPRTSEPETTPTRSAPSPSPATPTTTAPPTTSAPPPDPCETGWCTRVVVAGGVHAHYLYDDGPRSVFVVEEGAEICARWVPIPEWDRPLSPGVDHVWEVYVPDNTDLPDTYVVAIPRDGVTTHGPCDGPQS